MQCVQNRTEQLVVNDVFERASVYSSVCEMQENNSEISLNSWAQRGKVSVLPDVHRKKQQTRTSTKSLKHPNALFYNTNK